MYISPNDEAIRPIEKNVNIKEPKIRLALNLKGYAIASRRSPNPNPFSNEYSWNCSVRCATSISAFGLHIAPHAPQSFTVEPKDLTHSRHAGVLHVRQMNAASLSAWFTHEFVFLFATV